jgi:hypothetical protein
LLTDGTAPAVDYRIKERDDGRFEIVWNTRNWTPTSTGEIEAEISTAMAAEPSAAASEPALPAASAAAESAQPEAAPQPAAEAEAAPAPAPEAAAPIAAESEPSPQGDHDPELAVFETPRLIAELARHGYRATQARRPRAERPARERQLSKAKSLDDAAARGVMPTKPDVTSHANQNYQKRFDKLAELAAAGDWDAVAGYQCTGINSYAKDGPAIPRPAGGHAPGAAGNRHSDRARGGAMSDARTPVFTPHPISATPQFDVVLKPGEKLEATDVYASTTGQWSPCPCPGLTVQEGIATIWIRPQAPDPRDPRPDSEMVGRDAIFRDHNCSRCRDGERPCVRGNPRNCDLAARKERLGTCVPDGVLVVEIKRLIPARRVGLGW